MSAYYTEEDEDDSLDEYTERRILDAEYFDEESQKDESSVIAEDVQVLFGENYLPWFGGNNPAGNSLVTVRFRNGEVQESQIASSKDWAHNETSGDIVEFKVIDNPGDIQIMANWLFHKFIYSRSAEKVKELTELVRAFVNGEQLEYKRFKADADWLLFEKSIMDIEYHYLWHSLRVKDIS